MVIFFGLLQLHPKPPIQRQIVDGVGHCSRLTGKIQNQATDRNTSWWPGPLRPPCVLS